VRTLATVAAFAGLIALAVLSLGTLLSIFLATVLAMGVDPLVARLVARGWKRGPAALTVFAGLFVSVVVLVLLAVGPVWREVEEFIRALPGYWDELSSKPAFQDLDDGAGADDRVRSALGDLAAGLPEATSAVLGAAGGVFGSALSLVTLTFLALFLVMERPAITDWLFGFAPPAADARWRPVLEDAIRAPRSCSSPWPSPSARSRRSPCWSSSSSTSSWRTT
jgi:predicted PurR-regulated permease PerM